MSAEQSLILVVDDNEMNRDMLSRRLQRQGYRVEIAEDGVFALEMVAKQSFDLILLDIMMPRMTGYEVLEKVKSDPATQHIPVIMISAVDDLESVVKCVEIGADDYLFKPFNPILLKARVSSSLEKKRLYDKEIVQNPTQNAQAETNKSLVRHLIETLIAGNMDASIITPEFKMLDHARQLELSLDEMNRELFDFKKAFPNFQITIDDMIAENEGVFAILSVRSDINSLSDKRKAIVSKFETGKISSQEVFSSTGWLGA